VLDDDDLDLVHCGTEPYITSNQDTIISIKDYFVQTKEFYLFQNNPNSFNSSTVSRFYTERRRMQY